MKPTNQLPLLLITEHFAPGHGATAQLITDLACGLVARGIPVTVLTATAADGIELNAVQVVRLCNTKAETAILLKKLLRGVRFFCLALFWVFCHGGRGQKLLIASNPPFIGLLGPLLRLQGLRYVFIFQDLFPRSAVLSGLLAVNGFATTLLRALMAWVCRCSDATVVLSEAMATALQHDCGPGLPLKVIHNWAVEWALPGDRAQNEFAKKLGLEDTFLVQYSGNFGRLHDLHTLLQAAVLLRHSPLCFLFIGGGAREQELRNFKEKQQLKNVLYLPYQIRSELKFSLGACDIAVISLQPGVEASLAPCKFYGILASAKPVLLIAGFNCDLAQLVIKEDIGVVVEPGQFVELTEILLALQQNPARVAEMGQRSAELYERCFGLERSLDNYAALLR